MVMCRDLYSSDSGLTGRLLRENAKLRRLAYRLLARLAREQIKVRRMQASLRPMRVEKREPDGRFIGAVKKLGIKGKEK